MGRLRGKVAHIDWASVVDAAWASEGEEAAPAGSSSQPARPGPGSGEREGQRPTGVLLRDCVINLRRVGSMRDIHRSPTASSQVSTATTLTKELLKVDTTGHGEDPLCSVAMTTTLDEPVSSRRGSGSEWLQLAMPLQTSTPQSALPNEGTDRCATPMCSFATPTPSDGGVVSGKARRLFLANPETKPLVKRKRDERELCWKVTKRRKPDKENLEQLHLDFGQKTIGHVTCRGCGMVYTHGQAGDEVDHAHFHNIFVSCLKFAGWKRERVVLEGLDGRVILVLPTDPKHQLRKVDELVRLVDSELGYAGAAVYCGRSLSQVFLFISPEKRAVGCVVAERISEGYPVLPQDSSECTPSSWMCSTTPVPAQVGITRVWVASSHRRRGVATRLIDSVRAFFVPGQAISRTQLAFTDPTPDGHAFAGHYCATPTYLVYRTA